MPACRPGSAGKLGHCPRRAPYSIWAGGGRSDSFSAVTALLAVVVLLMLLISVVPRLPAKVAGVVSLKESGMLFFWVIFLTISKFLEETRVSEVAANRDVSAASACPEPLTAMSAEESDDEVFEFIRGLRLRRSRLRRLLVREEKPESARILEGMMVNMYIYKWVCRSVSIATSGCFKSMISCVLVSRTRLLVVEAKGTVDVEVDVESSC